MLPAYAWIETRLVWALAARAIRRSSLGRRTGDRKFGTLLAGLK
jgi:hypothetical protein